MSKYVRLLLFVAAGVVFITLIGRYDTKRREKIQKAGLQDLNLQLTGVVDTVIETSSYHGFGIIRLKIISSNVNYYDPRSKLAFYYCIIKNGLAEIYDHTPVPKSDTVIIDTKNETFSSMENGRRVEGSIIINTEEDYYDFISKHTILNKQAYGLQR